MDDFPRQRLCELIAKYGESLCDESLRCEGLLRDLCAQHRREVNVLIIALKEHIPADLRNSSSAMPIQVLLGRLTKRLEDQHATNADVARWAIESWALALGKISRDQLSITKEAALGSRSSSMFPAPTESAGATARSRHRAARASSTQPVYPSASAGAPGIPKTVSERKRLFLGLIIALGLFAAIAGVLFYAHQRSSQETGATTNNRPAAASAVPSVAQVGSAVEISSLPSDAKVLQNGVLIGTTPLRRNDLSAGEANFLLVLDGYLPREFKASLTRTETLSRTVELIKPALLYTGTSKVGSQSGDSGTPLAIKLGPDATSGIMTQTSAYGDLVVRFSGVWNGPTLRAVTGEVISQPARIQWEPESFILRFSDDGTSAAYECAASKNSYVAQLTAQSGTSAAIASLYKGTIRVQGNSGSSAGTPLTITLAADRRSGTMTQSSSGHGDTVVRFNGMWEGTTLQAVTGDVISKPKTIQWKPESFTLHFAQDGKRGSYECNSEGHTYSAELSPP